MSDKNSTGYVIRFAVILVTLSAAWLAFLSESLKPLQKANIEDETRRYILAATEGVEFAEMKEPKKDQIQIMYDAQLIKSVVLNAEGKEIEGDAFAIDIVKEYKATKNNVEDRRYPLFIMKNKDGKKRYVIPMAGNGLWGPIWAYSAISDDKNTLVGMIFDHKGETPGLGAEIKENPDFYKNFYAKMDKKIYDSNGEYKSIKVIKGKVEDSAPGKDHEVDGIAGATITCNGVSEMTIRSFKPYMDYIKKN